MREIQRTLTLTHGTDRAFSAFGALGRVPSEAIVVWTGVYLCRVLVQPCIPGSDIKRGGRGPVLLALSLGWAVKHGVFVLVQKVAPHGDGARGGTDR